MGVEAPLFAALTMWVVYRQVLRYMYCLVEPTALIAVRAGMGVVTCVRRPHLMQHGRHLAWTSGVGCDDDGRVGETVSVLTSLRLGKVTLVLEQQGAGNGSNNDVV